MVEDGDISHPAVMAVLDDWRRGVLPMRGNRHCGRNDEPANRLQTGRLQFETWRSVAICQRKASSIYQQAKAGETASTKNDTKTTVLLPEMFRQHMTTIACIGLMLITPTLVAQDAPEVPLTGIFDKALERRLERLEGILEANKAEQNAELQRMFDKWMKGQEQRTPEVLPSGAISNLLAEMVATRRDSITEARADREQRSVMFGEFFKAIAEERTERIKDRQQERTERARERSEQLRALAWIFWAVVALVVVGAIAGTAIWIRLS